MDDLRNAPITIRVESPTPEGKVPAREFLVALQELMAAAEDVEANVNGETSGSWVITDLGLGSAIISIASTAIDPRPMKLFFEALTSIQNGNDIIPSYMSSQSLESIRKVAKRKNSRVTISYDQTTIPLDSKFHKKINEWLDIKYESIGSVEGIIQVISLRNGRRFVVYDDFNRRIECQFDPPMLESIKDALGERVAIRGTIRYRANGRPASIMAKQLYRYPPENPTQTISINDLIGIIDLPMSAVDYIRQERTRHD